MSFFKRLFRSKTTNQKAVEPLYAAIVTQARQPFLFRDFGVPDTLDGRFDMLALHVYLVEHRLMNENEANDELHKLLPELMFRELDRGLRENCISDMGVPRRMKKMASAFYGRATAYENSRGTRAEMVAALARNVFPGEEVPKGAEALADYTIACMERLESQKLDDIINGQPDFAGPEQEQKS